ncbi:ABC-2 transporter permease [Candidatus Acetothermia bacterium]|nr:ABC-2 transporter permease [Candidatus Acetothermia bacterium]MBI3642780.1 ABC-2 transporter permease [Candidatus Acetothermia bacterium]
MKSWSISKNVFRRIRRDPRTLILVVLTPLFFILLYGISFSSTPKGLKLIVVNQDTGQASIRTEQVGRVNVPLNLGKKLIENLDHDVFTIVVRDDPDEARREVEMGEAWGALLLPPYFSNFLVSEALRRSGPREIDYNGQTINALPPLPPVNENNPPQPPTLILDNSNPVIAAGVYPAISKAFTGLIYEDESTLIDSSLMAIQPVYEKPITALDYTAPGVIGFAITLISIMLTSISIVRERTSGTLTRLLIAPVRAWEVSVGYMLAFLLIALFQAAELLLTSFYLFGIRFNGNPIWVFLIILIFSIGLQGVATLISTLAKNEFQAMQFILVILIPSIMLSGVFWPVETMPSSIQPIAWLNPLTHANAALRNVMLRGWDLSRIIPELSVLIGFAILMLILSIQSMKRQADTV